MRISLKQHRLWVLLAMVAGSAHAGVQSRPTLEGYRFHLYLFPDPSKLGRFFCETDTYWGGTGTGSALRFHHYEYYNAAPGDPHPAIKIWCTTSNGNPITTDSWAFSWARVCADGSPVVDGACPSPAGKPPNLCSGPCFGNPINMSAREKLQVEKDYVSAHGLEFFRHYSSLKLPQAAEAMASGWRHSYSKRVVSSKIQKNPSVPAVFTVDRYYPTPRGWAPYYWGVTASSREFTYILRPDGYSHYFTSTDQGLTWQADSDVKFQLRSAQFDGAGNVVRWSLITPEDDVETYDQAGRLISLQSRTGESRALVYSDETTPGDVAPRPGLLLRVTDSFGAALQFQYDASGRLSRMVDPGGNVFVYTYDTQDNLVRVTYPDGLTRRYLYNELAHQPDRSGQDRSHLLTGIEDEIAAGLMVRSSTFKYGDDGAPISTEHGAGIDKFTVNYSTNTVTDPLGTPRTYNYQRVNGVPLPGSVSQPAGAGSSAVWSVSTYDENGNPSSSIDFNGNKTCYAYELTRNLETARVEGLDRFASCATALAASTLSHPARKVTKQWHPTRRLPVRVSEPRLITLWEYDSSGNVLTKTLQATSDPAGAQGLSAERLGVPRSWRYTYNNTGQVLTMTGPRTDVVSQTSYAYDDHGNLIRVTNAAQHVTTLSNYDAHGRVGTLVDPNGVATHFAYSPRGWLTRRTVVASDGTAETTTYVYNGVGRLTRVTLPDNSTLTHTYDDAQRLIGVADSLGNRIVYTLDAMGNRVQVQVRDSNGVLSRRITRVYDALNRLHQVTGDVP